MTKIKESSQLRVISSSLEEMTYKFNQRLLFAFNRENDRRLSNGEKRLLYKDVWGAAGATSGAATPWFNGTNKMALDTCWKVKDVLRCNPLWLFDDSMKIDDPITETAYFNAEETRAEYNSEKNVVSGPDVRGEVPLISWVQAGSWCDVVDNFAPGDGEEMIPTIVPVKRHTYALQVDGDSMTNPNGWPSFPEGMIIIVEPDFDHQAGDFVVVKNGSNEATFKQLIRDGADWLLKPLNPRYPIKPLPTDATICGVVRGYGGIIR